MYMQMKTGGWNKGFGKNAYYRSINSAKVNWERFTWCWSEICSWHWSEGSS